MSGEFKSFYLTMGDYDMVAIFEAPDDAQRPEAELEWCSSRAPLASDALPFD
jgi:uncharacterized protein with GYD domain